MNPAQNQPATWSLSRWILSIAFVFAAHVGLIFAFSAPSSEKRRPASEPLEFIVLLDADANARWLQTTDAQDPTILALSHPRGFSGKAWDASARTSIEPLKWSDAPAYLPPDYDSFGLAFSAATGQRAAPDEFSSQRRVPPIMSTASTLPAATANSRLRLNPALQKRGLLRMPDLPRIETETTLPDTLVEIEVGRDGAVFSSRVSSRSGLTPPKDLQKRAATLALSHARTLRFGPMPQSDDPERLSDTSLTSGTLRYQWGYLKPTTAKADSQP